MYSYFRVFPQDSHYCSCAHTFATPLINIPAIIDSMFLLTMKSPNRENAAARQAAVGMKMLELCHSTNH